MKTDMQAKPESSHDPVPLEKAYLLLNHGPVTLISSCHQGRRNVMAASWAMPVDFSPPKMAVVIDRQTYSRELIERSGELVINIPSDRMLEAIVHAGTASGHSVDKLRELPELCPGSHVAAPLIAGCLAWLECKVLPEPHNQRQHDLFIVEVLAAWADPSVFRQGRWLFETGGPRTVHYSAGGQFFLTGEAKQTK
ncbi:flavin reductase family protein [Aquabacterium sp.]|uniref:flavin reductase family protein n=1 Tax=Aquabacterium sp. TaxID=1872578 RepID=UPI002E354A66|nr:flavin reductase family protein [Aquabacterium sp.]HEX5310537.1 flavin reductase family protein [Aquabacterium sp.]